MSYITNIETETLSNQNFRKVLHTSHYMQLVVMSLKPGEDIGEEVHGVDQFIRIEEGTGKTVLDGVESPVGDGSVVIVSAGTKHNIINTGDTEMKLYTVYAPANHKDKTIHVTKQDAEADEENDHFDGKVS